MRLEELSDQELDDWQQRYQRRKVIYLGTLAISVPALALLCSMLLFQIEDDSRVALIDRVIDTVSASYVMGANQGDTIDATSEPMALASLAPPASASEPVALIERLPEPMQAMGEATTEPMLEPAIERAPLNVMIEEASIEALAPQEPPEPPMHALSLVEPLPEPIVSDRELLNEEGMQDLDHLVQQKDVDTAQLFGLGVRTVVIDPGHGGRDPGAIGPNGELEKTLVLSIAKRLQQRLQKRSDLKVILTRDRDVKLSLRRRVDIALENNADLFVSLHLNTLPQKHLSIVETYYFGADKNKESLELAARENANSDYGVAEFKQLIDQLGNTVKQQESKSLASQVQNSLYSALQRKSPNLVNIGIKKAPFVVLLGAGVPSILVEATCLSNADEAERLKTDGYQNTIADAVSSGILSYVRANGGARFAKRQP